MTISLPEEELQKVKLVSEPTSANFTIDEGVRTSYVNNLGCPSSTTEGTRLLFPPATADLNLKRKEVPSGKYNFEQQLETEASMVDKKNWRFSMRLLFSNRLHKLCSRRRLH